MLKRSHRDIDLPSLVPPQFCAVSDARKEARAGGTSCESALKRSSVAWDTALLSAYMVEADMPRGPMAGLGMGLEIVAVGKSGGWEPRWNGSWSSHQDYMRFIFGEEDGQNAAESGKEVSLPAEDGGADPPQPSEDDTERSGQQQQEELHKRRRVRDEEDDALQHATVVVRSSTHPSVVESARHFAQRTTLRRGFFASALKRQLEALREENRRLKRLAVELLDDNERQDLFAGLGTEHRRIVTASPAALVSEKNPAEDGAIKDREVLSKIVESTRTTVAADNDVARRDLTLVEVVQQAQRAFVVTNPALPDNPIVWSSDEFSKLTGYDRSEVCGRNCRFLQGPKTNPKAVDAVRKAINNSHEASVVLLNYRKDGSTFWNRFFIAPLHDSKGNVTYYVGVQTDVSSSIRSPLLQPITDRPQSETRDDADRHSVDLYR